MKIKGVVIGICLLSLLGLVSFMLLRSEQSDVLVHQANSGLQGKTAANTAEATDTQFTASRNTQAPDAKGIVTTEGKTKKAVPENNLSDNTARFANTESQTDDYSDRVIIPGALPPELAEINQELNKMAHDLEKAKIGLDREAKAAMAGLHDDPEQVEKEAEMLIASINAQEGINSTAVESALDKKLREPLTYKKAIDVQDKMDTIDSDLIDLERQLEQMD